LGSSLAKHPRNERGVTSFTSPTIRRARARRRGGFRT
jgi:hypothetical protein